VVIPPVVIPPVVVAPVTEGTYAPTSPTSTTLGWTASKDADTVIVTVNGKTVAELPGNVTGLVLGSLIGPKDIVEVIAKDAAGNASVLASFAYVPHGDIALGGVTFAADSAKLTASAKAALKKYATAIVTHGFTTATVAAFTKYDASRSTAFRTKLAKARAAAITAYLNAQFTAAGATVTVTSTGKGVKARTGVVTTK
jgi:outer membrane protein OmpA-like peptidoglycan-associated protein